MTGIEIHINPESCRILINVRKQGRNDVCGLELLEIVKGRTQLKVHYANMDEEQLRMTLHQIEALWIRYPASKQAQSPEFAEVHQELDRLRRQTLVQYMELREELSSRVWSPDVSIHLTPSRPAMVTHTRPIEAPAAHRQSGQFGLKLHARRGQLLLEPVFINPGKQNSKSLTLNHFDDFHFGPANDRLLTLCRLLAKRNKAEREDILLAMAPDLSGYLENTPCFASFSDHSSGAITPCPASGELILRFYLSDNQIAEPVISSSAGTWFIEQPAHLASSHCSWIFGWDKTGNPKLIRHSHSISADMWERICAGMESESMAFGILMDPVVRMKPVLRIRPRPLLTIHQDKDLMTNVEIGLRFQAPALNLPDDEPVTVEQEPGYTELVLAHLMDGFLRDYSGPHEKLPVFVLSHSAFHIWLSEEADSLLDSGFEIYLRHLNKSLAKGQDAHLLVNATSADSWLEIHASLRDRDGQPISSDWGFLSESGFLSRSGHYVRLMPSDIERLRELILLGLNQEIVKLPLAMQHLLTAPEDEESLDLRPVIPTGLKTKRPLPFIAETIPGFGLCLRDYQKAGLQRLLHWHSTATSGLLADEMGLGKTIQVLAFLCTLKHHGTRGPHLIVCPLSAAANWEREIQAHTNLSVEVMTASDKDFTSDVVIATYGQIRTRLRHLKSRRFTVLVADEAQMAKNANTGTAISLKGLHATMRLALTGTPLENSLMDLFSIVEYLHPGYLGNRSWFLKHFATPIEKQEHLRRTELLKRMLQPIMLRRTKAAVLPELPPKILQDISVDLSPGQKKLYVLTVKEALRSLEEYKRENRYSAPPQSLILSALTRMRQICSAPWLVDESLARVPSAKLEYLCETIPPLLEQGKGVLVFSQYPRVLEWLHDHPVFECKKFRLYGSHSSKHRKEAVENFQQLKSGRLFLISLRAGGVALNLGTADYVFLLDPWWNPFVEQQAIDRAHRLGNKQSVNVVHIYARNTLEERIRTLQTEKQSRLETFAEDQDSVVMSLDSETLHYLLAGEGEAF